MRNDVTHFFFISRRELKHTKNTSTTLSSQTTSTMHLLPTLAALVFASSNAFELAIPARPSLVHIENVAQQYPLTLMNVSSVFNIILIYAYTRMCINQWAYVLCTHNPSQLSSDMICTNY